MNPLWVLTAKSEDAQAVHSFFKTYSCFITASWHALGLQSRREISVGLPGLKRNYCCTGLLVSICGSLLGLGHAGKATGVIISFSPSLNQPAVPFLTRGSMIYNCCLQALSEVVQWCYLLFGADNWTDT